jgi:CAAX prenyl protease-like protein
VTTLKPASPDWIALIAVGGTVGLHLALQADAPNPWFIIGACLFWAAFIVVRASQDRGVFRRWGFRADNLLQASAIPAGVFIAGAVGFATWAALHGTLRFPWQTALLFLVYPVWGVIQQFLTLAIVVGNLELAPRLGRQRPLLVVIGAALFAAVHAYDGWLAAATFCLELLVVPLYLAYRNLWPLGVLHGWLGGLFYLWVMGRDMWAENFG